MTKWTCTNRRTAMTREEHFLFRGDDGRFAIADHSLSDRDDPATAEDGLLVLDTENYARVRFASHGQLDCAVPVRCARDGDAPAWVSTGLENLPHVLAWLDEARCPVVVEPPLADTVSLLSPRVNAHREP